MTTSSVGPDEPSPFARRIAEAQRAETLRVEVTGTKGDKYTVRRTSDGSMACTCPSFKFGMGKPCKHIVHIEDCALYRCLICGEARCNGNHAAC